MSVIMLASDEAKCAGCGACSAACPVQAISMEMDIYGHAFPKIHEDMCIQCGKCVGVCDFVKPFETNQPLKAYAATGKDDDVVKYSASGGVFATLADAARIDGVNIAGAVMDITGGQADVYHLLSDKKEDLQRMQGSKYVQSEAWRCYQEVIQRVKAGERVLFSGTPCQVAAIKKLTGDPENLITMDLVCHGVPSQKMLNDYLHILAKRFGGNVRQFLFRDKSCEKNYCAKINITGKRKSIWLRSHYLSFYTYFLGGEISRESCYACPYATTKRISDITIGDYWGIEQFHNVPSDKAWSCVLVNTEKGNAFLDAYGAGLTLVSTQTEWVARNNRQLIGPSLKGEKRKEILKRYTEGGYLSVEADFVRYLGGTIPFYWRMLKNRYANQKMQVKKCKNEN